MEAKDNPPAASPDKKEDAPKEKEVVVDWAQSVKDSKWASAEPSPSLDTRSPKQDPNTLASQWASAGNSQNSYGSRKNVGYGYNNNYKKDQSYNTRSGDFRRNNGWDSRPYDRFSQQNDQNRSRYDNQGYEPRNFDKRFDKRQQYHSDQAFDRQTFSPSSESKWATANVLNKSGSEDLAQGAAKTNDASSLETRPWNKRFLAGQDESTAPSKYETKNDSMSSELAAVQTEVDINRTEEKAKDEGSQERGEIQLPVTPETTNISEDDKKCDNEAVVTDSNALQHDAEKKSHDEGKSHSTEPEQPPSIKKRPSIDIGYWGRPPTVDSEATDVQDNSPKKSPGDNKPATSTVNKKQKDFQGSSASIYASKASEHSSKPEGHADGHSKKPYGSSERHSAFAESPSQHNNGKKDRSNTRHANVEHSKSGKTEDRIATGGFVKHNIDEEALNARIERIRLQNEKIQQRQKLIEEEEKEIAKQLQSEKEERDRRRKEDEKLEEAARLAAEEAKRDRIEREKRIAEEIRVEREANAARKVKALASRDWDAEKGDDDLYIKEGRNRGDFNNRDRSSRNHRGLPGREAEEDRKKHASEAKSFTVTEEKWPDLGSAVAGTPAKAAVWPARAAAEAKVQQKQESGKEAPVKSPPSSKASAPKLASLTAPRKAEIENAEEGKQKDSISWEDIIAKQKPVTDWATDSPTNEDINFEDSPFK
ncbi:hypothetical protein K450DRAFT_250506 [Umbelopsis ramanniana AG]|uniref:Uncharacterized protein n=1 Tax=Umbelopsis ramanniana AG TaxID=1314678 RepID=A0AAD5E6K9_UMBRA|nr:uncharacterized protein K450DRAFT_250506 [Umbelopsis ramanniana AG]KAI8577719.1 hypothetical protein K450DRAFT_250506 [Umbelopsis ramanniana AG]